MAKAQFHKHQKVWVESVGAWSVIERIIPIWAKGFDEPVRITYDVGLGREFLANELSAEVVAAAAGLAAGEPKWRILRTRNKWQTPEDCSHHPYPGTFPVVVTDENDWGGWRVPGAEYDRNPTRFESQARLIEQSPRLLRLAKGLVELVSDASEDVPESLLELAREAHSVLRYCGDPASNAEPQPEPRSAEFAE